jgi:hypothetical protein
MSYSRPLEAAVLRAILAQESGSVALYDPAQEQPCLAVLAEAFCEDALFRWQVRLTPGLLVAPQ